MIIRRSLHRTFWSLYGRYVWDDAQGAQRAQPTITSILELLRQHRQRPDERILDAGCGTGTYALAIAQAGYQVVGVDGAAGMLVRATIKQRAAPDLPVTFILADLDAPLPFPDASFDHAIAVSVLQALAQPARTLGELRRVLRPGGMLVVIHQPRPPRRSFGAEVRQRAAYLPKGASLKRLLVTIKVAAERLGATRYWNETEIAALLRTQGFAPGVIQAGPPMIIPARRL